MKRMLLFVATAAGLAGCAATNAPYTAWGKEGVSMLEYRTDGGQCAVMAATADPNKNAANSAGGINGQNGSANARLPGAVTTQNPSQGASAGAPVSVGGGGVYREAASADFVTRAANQQQAQEMQVQKARTEMLRSCLTERGYREFELTKDQRLQLSKLAAGTDERREYLYKLGTDPAVLKSAVTVTPPAAPAPKPAQ
jgi:hypothetical protein